MTRAAMWLLLAVVAAAAAVLSFSALRDLALLCGFAPSLAWLLPVVIDAGAAAGCLAWLRPGAGNYSADVSRSTRFARALTVVLLASSVAGNAVVHGLAAYQLAPPWWLVVAVSAVAPAVLGAVVHLAVLVGRPGADCLTTGPSGPKVDAEAADNQGDTDQLAGLGRRRLAAQLGVTEYQARQLLAARNGAER